MTHIPNALWTMPRTAAYDAPKPVKFWKSLKTNDADCLLSLHATTVMMTTKNETIFHMRMKRERLSRIFARKIFESIAIRAIKYVTRTVCHPVQQSAYQY